MWKNAAMKFTVSAFPATVQLCPTDSCQGALEQGELPLEKGKTHLKALTRPKKTKSPLEGGERSSGDCSDLLTKLGKLEGI